MTDLSHVFTADDRDRVSRLQWYAQNVVDGLAVGLHRSPQKGSSIEFKEHRAYVRGDETRLIDWKLFGKTDRLYIREFEDETNLRATLVVDQSGSMSFQGQESECSKQQYALGLAACLSHLFIGQQDAVGLATFDTQLRDYLPPGRTPAHLHQLQQTLANATCRGETSLGNVLQQLAPSLRRRGVVALLSDCFDDLPTLIRALSLLRQMGNEVVIFQIWDPDELNFPFRRRTQFKSLENSQQTQRLDPATIRKSYLNNLKNYQKDFQQQCARYRIALVTCDTSVPHSRLLTNFVGGGRG